MHILRTFLPLFVLALSAQSETLWRTPQHDAANWLFMAQRMSFGEMPGRDLWDNKLPPIYLVGRAAVLSGAPQAFLWISGALATAIGALAVASLARDLGASARNGAFLAILLIVCSGHPSYHAGGYTTEVYAMPLTAIAVWAGWRARGAFGWNVLAGLGWALAAALRPPLALAAVVVTVTLLIAGSRRLRAAGGVATGIALALLLVFIHPLANGYLNDCIDAAMLWPLSPHESGPFTPTLTRRLILVAQDIAKIAWLHAAAIAGLTLLVRNGPRLPALLLGGWYLSSLLTAITGWTTFAHYHYVAFAPACLLAALLLTNINPGLAPRIAVGLCATTLAVTLFLNVKQFVRERESAADPDQRALLAWIESNVGQGESILFWVGGRNADLTRRANRPAGVRHFMAYSYFDMDLRLVDEFAAELAQHPPKFIVQGGSTDMLPVVSESPESMAQVRQIQKTVSAGYDPAAEIGSFRVFESK